MSPACAINYQKEYYKKVIECMALRQENVMLKQHLDDKEKQFELVSNQLKRWRDAA